MAAVADSFYRRVLELCGLPVNDANLFTCHAWQAMEGGTARNNPWNTTKDWPHATDYNSVGVKHYATADDGMQATARTLQLHYYDAIRAGFAASDPQRTADAIDHSPWGTHGVGAYVRANWHGQPGGDEVDDATIEKIARRTAELVWKADSMPAPDKAPSAAHNPTWSHDNGLRGALDMLYDIKAWLTKS